MDCALEGPPPPPAPSESMGVSAGKPNLLVNLSISVSVWSQLSCDLSDLRLINSCNWEHTLVQNSCCPVVETWKSA